MAENQRSSSSSSEEDDFCRISDGGHSDQGGDVQAPPEGAKQPTEEEEGSVELSEFCQVVFQNVAESYKPGKPLECYYTLSPVLVPTNKDYIAVFKVGWNSIRHYVTFEYAPYPKNWKAGDEYKQCILFNYHHLPKEEDGEFYQFCYIDSYGKMRGASTPFQFLLTSMDDFMEVADESIDFLMIQSKKSQNSELIVQLQGEKDALAAEKAQIEREKNQLVGKVEELESALSVKDEEVKEFTDRVKALDETLAQIPVLEGKLADCEKRQAELEAEKKRYGESLQQTTEAFMEVQNNITELEDERNKLKNELELLLKERDEFKAQFASSEKDNETLRAEIDSLKHQLMEANEQNQVILAKEGALKEEKVKVEQQLLVASSDQHKKSLESRVRDLQGKLAKSEDDYKKLDQQLKAMSDFHHKLKQDYEDSKIECDALKTKLLRQGDDFLEKQKRMERQLSLEKHNASEKRVLLETQVNALKEGIQKLAKDKENLVKGTVGSEEASNIAVKSFKDKMMSAKRKSEEEAHKRKQVQRELLELKAASGAETEDNEKIVEFYKNQLDEAREGMEQMERDTSKEIDSLRVRLEMAKEEYKLLYKEVRGLESKKGRKGATAVEGAVPAPEPVVEKEVAPVQSAAAAPLTEPVALDQDTYDSRDMTLSMEEMTRQLCQLTGELKKRRAKVDEYKKLYEEERMRRKEAENLYQEMQESKRIKDEENMNKYRAKKEELANWKDKYNRMHDDYLRTKHTFESFKFDTNLAKSPVKKTAPRPVESTASNVVQGIIPRPPPELHYRNPYKEDESLPLATPPGKYRNPYVGGASPDLSGYQSIRNASKLPEPLAPQVLPQAKQVAVKAMIQDKHDGGGVRTPSAPPMPSQEDEEDLYQAGTAEEAINEIFARDIQSDSVNMDEVRPTSPTVYHDAPEYPIAPPDKSCPQCSMQFAADISDDFLASHMQSHFAYQCPECQALMDRDTHTDDDYKRHLAAHRSDEDPKHYCPFCQKTYAELTVEQVEQHVQSHFPN